MSNNQHVLILGPSA